MSPFPDEFFPTPGQIAIASEIAAKFEAGGVLKMPLVYDDGGCWRWVTARPPAAE